MRKSLYHSCCEWNDNYDIGIVLVGICSHFRYRKCECAADKGIRLRGGRRDRDPQLGAAGSEEVTLSSSDPLYG